jgi:hypothetical protein
MKETTDAEVFRDNVIEIFKYLILLAIYGAIVMLLWNALLPTLFGWTTITYLQAVGIKLLIGTLWAKRINDKE